MSIWQYWTKDIFFWPRYAYPHDGFLYYSFETVRRGYSFTTFYLEIDNSTNINSSIRHLDFVLQYDNNSLLATQRNSRDFDFTYFPDFAIDQSGLLSKPEYITNPTALLLFINDNYFNNTTYIPEGGKSQFIIYFEVPHDSGDNSHTFQNTQFTLSMLTTDPMTGKRTCLNTIEIPITTEQA